VFSRFNAVAAIPSAKAEAVRPNGQAINE